MAVLDNVSEFDATGVGTITVVSGGHEIFTDDDTALAFVFAVSPITAAVDVGVTENGNALTLVANEDNIADDFSVFVFERVGLTGTGFHTVTTTFAAARDHFAGVGLSYTQVSTTRMLRTGPVLNDNADAPAVVAAPAAGEDVLVFLGLRDETLTITEGPGQTTLRNALAGGGATGVRMWVASKPGDITTVLSEAIDAAAELILFGMSVVDVAGGLLYGSGGIPGAAAVDTLGTGTWDNAVTVLDGSNVVAIGQQSTTHQGSALLASVSSFAGTGGARSRSADQLDEQLTDHDTRIARLERTVLSHGQRLHRVDGRV